MTRKTLIGLVITFIIIFMIFSVVSYIGYKTYSNFFRLDYQKISTSLEGREPLCQKLKDCKLLPGDVLIRRYITRSNDLFTKYFNPYFNHSAVYIGDDNIFEAAGNFETPENQVRIRKFSDSDWMDEEMNNFVVFRMKEGRKNPDKIKRYIENLINIADDPEYLFGIYNQNKKTATCSDAILNFIKNNGLVEDINIPTIVTPDYLFWTGIKDTDNFELVGYNIVDRK